MIGLIILLSGSVYMQLLIKQNYLFMILWIQVHSINYLRMQGKLEQSFVCKENHMDGISLKVAADGVLDKSQW